MYGVLIVIVLISRERRVGSRGSALLTSSRCPSFPSFSVPFISAFLCPLSFHVKTPPGLPQCRDRGAISSSHAHNFRPMRCVKPLVLPIASLEDRRDWCSVDAVNEDSDDEGNANDGGRRGSTLFIPSLASFRLFQELRFALFAPLLKTPSTLVDVRLLLVLVLVLSTRLAVLLGFLFFEIVKKGIFVMLLLFGCLCGVF
jgi:hypothetical protein